MSSSRSSISTSDRANDRKNKEKAGNLAHRLMVSDPAVLGVLISDKQGRALAFESQKGGRDSETLGAKEIERIGFVEFMALKMGSRPGQDTGSAEYVMYTYEKFKILVTALEGDLFLGVKLTRSSNAEYILNRVLRDFR